MMDYNDGYGHMGGGFISPLFNLLIIALVVLGVILLVKHLQKPTGTGYRTADDILKERYAKGEIDKKEFQEKRKDLKDS